MIIGKDYKFSAAHMIKGHPKCGNLHGHTYTVRVEIEASIKSEGFVLDFGELNALVNRYLTKYDHVNLNEFMECSSCEMIASSLLHELLKTIPFITLQFVGLSVQVQEGEGGYARAVYSVQPVPSI